MEVQFIAETEKKYDLKNKKVSIFSYAEEFDNFLNKKYKSKIKNSAINTDDILKMKFKDGKFEYTKTSVLARNNVKNSSWLQKEGHDIKL